MEGLKVGHEVIVMEGFLDEQKVGVIVEGAMVGVLVDGAIVLGIIVDGLQDGLDEGMMVLG
jgi:hypothetical protein